MPSTPLLTAAAPPPIETAPRLAAALLFLMPLLLSAHDVSDGLQLGFAALATLLALQGMLYLAGATQRSSAFAAVLWSTVAVALASWFLPALDLLDPSTIALLPLIAANAGWWRTHRTQNAIALGTSSIVLALACVAIGLLRGVVDAFARDDLRRVVDGFAQWLASPAGLLITAAVAVALWQLLRPSSGAPSARDSHFP
jgi:hypothetical protein